MAELQRAMVVGPLARLELSPLDPLAPDGHDPLIEAHMPAEAFRALAVNEGATLVVRPRQARVFVQAN